MGRYVHTQSLCRSRVLTRSYQAYRISLRDAYTNTSCPRSSRDSPTRRSRITAARPTAAKTGTPRIQPSATSTSGTSGEEKSGPGRSTASVEDASSGMYIPNVWSVDPRGLKKGCRSEFGIPSFPDLRTVDYWLAGDTKDRWAQSKSMAQHDRAGGHERRFAILMNENFKLTGDFETCAVQRLDVCSPIVLTNAQACVQYTVDAE